MYAQSRNPDGGQSFRRGEYTIPANYAGNAFTADEPIVETAPPPPPQTQEKPERDTFRQEEPPKAVETSVRPAPCEPRCEELRDDHRRDDDARGSIFRDLLRRLEHLEFDDFLLIGLVILLMRDEDKNNDEVIILLAILFFSGLF